MHADTRERVRLGCYPELPLQRLQSFLGLLYERRHELRIDVVHLHSGEQLARLRDGTLALGLVDHPVEDPQLVAEPLFPGEPLAAILPIGHRCASKPTVGPDDLAADPLIIPRRDGTRPLLECLSSLAGARGYGFGHVLEAAGADTRDVLVAVADGRGITLAPASTLRTVGELGTIVSARPLDPAIRTPDTMLAWRSAVPDDRTGVPAVARAVARELYGACKVYRASRSGHAAG